MIEHRGCYKCGMCQVFCAYMEVLAKFRIEELNDFNGVPSHDVYYQCFYGAKDEQ